MGSQTLAVTINDTRIGTLTPTRKGARFAFEQELQGTYSGQPLLSTSLLVKSRPYAYAEGLTNAWFSGLLPEGARLERISRNLGCSSSDYFSILREYGWECAGAVSLLPDGSLPPRETNRTVLSERELAAFLANLPEYEDQLAKPIRLSLGGFQEKACLCGTSVAYSRGYVEDGCFSVPGSQSISTHILKPQPASRYPHLVEGEAWTLNAAAHAARCAEAALLKTDDAPETLVVTRFDRSETSEGIRRVHQEDCCQALGLPPSGKYASSRQEKGDDPSYKGIAKLLQRYSLDASEETTELLRQLCVNLAMGNTDAHAKNYSFLYETPCVPTLSPMYDLVPVVDIEPAAKHLSLRINHKIMLGEIHAEDLIAEATSWGMSASRAESTIEETLRTLRQGIHAASLIYPEAGKRHAEQVDARISAIMQG